MKTVNVVLWWGSYEGHQHPTDTTNHGPPAPPPTEPLPHKTLAHDTYRYIHTYHTVVRLGYVKYIFKFN